jgi:hypothetical protein
MSGVHIIPNVIESKEDRMFAANIKTVDTSINFDTFDDWDARAYSFTPGVNGTIATSHLYDFNTGSMIQISAGMYDVDKFYDCYNKYTNVNNRYKDFATVESFSIEDYDGRYDRYTADGMYYGGTGKNVSWRFVVAEVVGDTSPAETQHPSGMIGHLRDRI